MKGSVILLIIGVALTGLGWFLLFRAHQKVDGRPVIQGEVTELIPGQRVKWKCVEGGTEWIGTEVIFDLRDEKGITVVFFAQRGWREQVEFMHYCSTKWATYLLSLKSLCETGTGAPYPNDLDIG